jgi:glycerol-3-phosphate acyltransferase PlsY
MVEYILVAVIAYLIGSVNFSIIFSKKFAGFDVREKGSGNAGTTNMLRSVGKGAAALTLVCDILKGVVAVGMAIVIGYMFKDFANKAGLVQVSAIAVILGHTFPVFYKFKGGKGIATSLGVLFMVNWRIALICLVFALVLMIITKMVSVGSIASAILFPILVLFVNMGVINADYLVPGNGYFIFSVLLALLVAFNHRSNIKRLLNGTENKISFKK